MFTEQDVPPYAVVVYAPGNAGREDSRHASFDAAQSRADFLWAQYGDGLDSLEIESDARGTVRVYR